MHEIILDLEADGGHRYQTAFEGRWLVDPDGDFRALEPEYDAGACYGVALTANGNIVMYVRHVNEMWAPGYEVFPTLEDAAASDEWPTSIISMAAGEVGSRIPMELPE